MEFLPSSIKFFDMLKFDETLQSNTSCCVDDGTNEMLLSKIKWSKDLALTDLDNHGNIFLEKILRKISSESKEEDGPCLDLISKFIPIKLAFSETDKMNLDLLDYPYSLLSFSCLNTSSNLYFKFCRKESNQKVSQFCIGHSFSNDFEENISSSRIQFSDPEMIHSGNCQHIKQEESSAKVLTVIIRNYICVFLNLSVQTYVYRNSLNYQNLYTCLSKSNSHLDFCQIFYYTPCSAAYIHGVVCNSLFDSEKLFSSKCQMFIHITLTIIQNFIFLVTAFPIKNSGFDFFSKNNFLIIQASIRKENKTRIIQVSSYKAIINIESQPNSTQTNISRDTLLINNEKSIQTNSKIMKTFNSNFLKIGPSLSRYSLRNSQHNISVQKNDYDSITETLSASSSCRPRYNLQNNKCATLQNSVSNLISRFSPQKLLKENRQPIWPSRRSKHAFIKQLSQSDSVKYQTSNQNPLKQVTKTESDKLQSCILIESVAVRSEINFAMQLNLDEVVNTITKFLVYDLWNMRTFSNWKLSVLPKAPCRYTSSLAQGLRVKTNLQAFIISRREKLHRNKNAWISAKGIRSPLQKGSGNQSNFNGKPHKTGKPPESNIFDLLNSQTIFCQPPKSCFKSKYSSRNKDNRIRNLSWNLIKTDIQEKLISRDQFSANNNRFIPSDKKPSSIFDFAKSRCASADLFSNIHLTNEELIKASKRPFSHNGILKSMTDGFSKRKRIETSSRIKIQLPTKGNQHSYCYRIPFIPSLNHSERITKDNGKSPREILMNRYKAHPKIHSFEGGFHFQPLVYQNGILKKRNTVLI